MKLEGMCVHIPSPTVHSFVCCSYFSYFYVTSISHLGKKAHVAAAVHKLGAGEDDLGEADEEHNEVEECDMDAIHAHVHLRRLDEYVDELFLGDRVTRGAYGHAF